MKNYLLHLVLFLLPALSFAQSNNDKPFVLGTIHTFFSKELREERVLNIYLPPGYSKNDTTHYSVIYLLDGSADEDFIHVVGLVQFNTFPWIQDIPNSIVVGIANVDRKRDFTYPTSVEEDKKKYPSTGHSDKFMAFLEKEVQPYIEQTYRTNTDKMLIGQSLGGLLATDILLKKPDLFNQYVIISPSLWWDDGSLLRQTPADLRQKTKVYIGVSKEGLGPSKTPHVMEVDANLLAEKLRAVTTKNLQVYFDYLPEENHATISHQAISHAFRWLYR